MRTNGQGRKHEPVVARVAATAHFAVDRAADAANLTVDRLAEGAESLEAGARRRVSAQPLQALGIALAVGFLLGRVLR